MISENRNEQCNLIWGAKELKHPSTQHLNSNLVATKRHHPIVYIGGPCVQKELGSFSHFQFQEQLQCTWGSSWPPSRTISFALWWHHYAQPVRPGSLKRKHKIILFEAPCGIEKQQFGQLRKGQSDLALVCPVAKISWEIFQDCARYHLFY